MELISYDSMRTRKATALFLLIQMEQEEQLLQAQDLLLQVKYYFKKFVNFFISSNIMKIINAPRTPTLQVHVYRETNFFFIILIFYVSSELLSHECLLHNHFVFYMSYFAAFVAFPTSFLLSILLWYSPGKSSFWIKGINEPITLPLR